MVVMIVDDDPDDIHLYCDLLEAIDPAINVKTFLQSPEALSYLLETKSLPDLVILDLNMPRIGGLDFLAKIRSEDSLKRLHVVVITTTCTEENTKAVLALRTACLRKQHSFENFKILLKRLLTEMQKA
jgi:CheY-like chemotaxis protein